MSTTTQEPDNVERIDQFLAREYREELGELARNYPSDQRALELDFTDIYRFDSDLADRLRSNPDRTIERFNEALRKFDLPADVDLDHAEVHIVGLNDVRPVGSVPRERNFGRLIETRGQVTKATGVKPRLTLAVFECQRCGTRTDVPQRGDEFQEPHQCPGCERQGPFRIDQDASDYVDSQFVRIQEPPEETNGGDGQEIDALLRHDLVQACQAGDRITLTGKVHVEEPDDSPECDTRFDPLGLTVEETDFEDIDTMAFNDEILAHAAGSHGDPYQLLCESIAPGHYGDDPIKLALALALFGGAARERPDGSRERGDSHILLLGDPGAGKTEFLRALESIAPRATFNSGKGASAAGITAAATKDSFGGDQWTLEAGALVLADGGVACIDEIDKVDEEAVSSLHGALESQKVEVSKAGINATLRARTSLIAAGNPKHGRFDDHEPFAEQIDLDPALISRFDLIFMVQDQPDEETDRKVAGSVIERHDDPETASPAVDAEILRAWVAKARQEYQPTFADQSVKDRLRDYYVEFRDMADENGPVPITARKLEALIRLSQASARVRLSETIEHQDIERAVSLVEHSLNQVGIDEETGEYDADIVNTGRSKSQKERYETIKATIREKEGADPVHVDEIVAATDIEEGDVRHALKNMADGGEMYTPDGDYETWRVV